MLFVNVNSLLQFKFHHQPHVAKCRLSQSLSSQERTLRARASPSPGGECAASPPAPPRSSRAFQSTLLAASNPQPITLNLPTLRAGMSLISSLPETGIPPAPKMSSSLKVTTRCARNAQPQLEPPPPDDLSRCFGWCCRRDENDHPQRERRRFDPHSAISPVRKLLLHLTSPAFPRCIASRDLLGRYTATLALCGGQAAGYAGARQFNSLRNSEMICCSYFLNEKKGWGLEISEMKRALAEARSKGTGHEQRVRIVVHCSAVSDTL